MLIEKKKNYFFLQNKINNSTKIIKEIFKKEI